MYILKKLYPRNGAESYLTTTSLVFIAEGYTAAQETQFYQDVDQAFQRMLDYHNLINLRLNNNSLSIYTLFVASSQSGIASNQTEAINRTVFESYLSNGLHLNYNKVKDVLEDTYFDNDLSERSKLIDRLLIFDSDRNQNLKEAIPVFIFPYNATQIGEIENFESNTYYYIATTLDNYYEQVILRSLFRILGLGDEFELEGSDYLTPDEETGAVINGGIPNLIYSLNPNSFTPLSTEFKWRGLFTSFDTTAISVHPHPGLDNIPDYTLPTIPFSYENIELWEGGGYFRKNVYRSAYDCLLRRRIGYSDLPVKEQKVALCPLCQMYLYKRLN